MPAAMRGRCRETWLKTGARRLPKPSPKPARARDFQEEGEQRVAVSSNLVSSRDWAVGRESDRSVFFGTFRQDKSRCWSLRGRASNAKIEAIDAGFVKEWRIEFRGLMADEVEEVSSRSRAGLRMLLAKAARCAAQVSGAAAARACCLLLVPAADQ